MIIYTPIDMPELIVDDWDIFWNIWNNESSNLVKVHQNTLTSPVNPGYSKVWTGFDVFTRDDFSPSWQAKYIDIKDKLPKFYSTLEEINELVPVSKIRLIQSQIPIMSHTDDNLDTWSVRAYLYYTDNKSQWYFTKPEDRNGNRTYISLPEETKWFAYNDKHCWHGTDFIPNHKKILLQLYPINYFDKRIISIVDLGKEKYNKYTIDHAIL